MKETTHLINKIELSLRFIIENELDLNSQRLMLNFSGLWFQDITHMIDTQGMRTTLAYYKQVRLGLTRGLSGKPLRPSEISLFMGMTHDGLPKSLSLLLPLLRKGANPSQLRVIMSFVTGGRTIEVPPIPVDTRSITDPSNPKDFPLEDFKVFVKRFNTRYREIPPMRSFTSFTPMFGRGPNGPALRSCIGEASQLPDEVIDCFKVISPELHERLIALRGASVNDLNEWKLRFNTIEGKTFYYGKISRIPDKEGKTRIITVLNYWSQNALKALHDSCEEILKGLPGDCTYDQTAFKDILALETDSLYHSFDLKDATDRFPRFLQKAVIESLGGVPIADAGEFLLTQPVWDPLLETTVRYSVGQPMGAFSSGPVFALTHGMLVGYLASKINSNYRTFKILGDDIVIRDNQLAEKYHETLSNLDIPISGSKTMQSKTTFEFAKRWFHEGIEISPFPLNALHESLTFPLGLVETFRTALDKGGVFANTGTGPGTVSRLLKIHEIHPAFARKIISNYTICTSFPRRIDNSYDCQGELVKFLKTIGKSVSCTSWRSQASEVIRYWVPVAVGEMFIEDLEAIEPYYNSEEDQDIRSLESLLDLERAVFGTETHQEASDTVQSTTPSLKPSKIEYNPLLNLLKESQSEMYKTLLRVAEGGSWSELERVFKLHPTIRLLSSEVIRKERSQVRVLKAKSRFIKTLQRLLVTEDPDYLD